MSQIVTARRAFIAVIHVFLFAAAYVLALLLRFDLDVPTAVWKLSIRWLPFAVAIYFAVFMFLRMFTGSWRYVGVTDLLQILRASAIAGTLSGAGWYFTSVEKGFPRSVFVLHAAAV